jgi:hypothetical protein
VKPLAIERALIERALVDHVLAHTASRADTGTPT